MSLRNSTETEQNPDPKTNQAQFFPLIVAVLLAYLGQMILNPILAPLSREIGLEEWHIGACISLAALALTLTSAWWGRAALRIGVRRLLIIALTLAMLALSGFAFISRLGMSGALSGVALVCGVIITRGLFYGGAIAAVAPASQTYVVTHTKTEAERVKAVGMIGAAQGFSSILGAVIGGGLAALGGLMLPLIVMPLMIAAGIVVLLTMFKPHANEQRIAKPAVIAYRDPRVFPFLVCGFLMFTVFSTLATLYGFLLQDSLRLNSAQTATLTAACMAIMGVSMIISQAALAPKSGWTATQLLRRGLLLTCIGVSTLVAPVHVAFFIVSAVLVGFGMGLAMPGYSAGPTLTMETHEQGGLAGLINANNGAAYVVAPLASTAAYSLNHAAPIFGGIIALIIAVTLCFTHPTLRA